MSSFQVLFENEVQKLTKKYISQFIGTISKDFNIPEEELYKRWNGEKTSTHPHNVIESDYHKMKAHDLVKLCRSRKVKFTSNRKSDTIRALEEDDMKKKNIEEHKVSVENIVEENVEEEKDTEENVSEKNTEEKDEEENDLEENDLEENDLEEEKDEEENVSEKNTEEKDEEENDVEENVEENDVESENEFQVDDIPMIECNDEEEIEENFEFTDNYEKMKSKDLIKLCKERNIKPKSNHKDNLISALREGKTDDISRKTLEQLKLLCQEKGIPFRKSVSKKNELIELLNNFRPDEPKEIEEFQKNVELMMEKEKEQKKLIDCSIEELRERCKEYGIESKKKRHEELLEELEIYENNMKYNQYRTDTEGIL